MGTSFLTRARKLLEYHDFAPLSCQLNALPSQSAAGKT
jgi:hypothetical protein